MRHTLIELEAIALQWLDDPLGTRFDSARLRMLLNLAYQTIVDLIDTFPQPWSVGGESAAKTITPVSGTREYDVGDPGTIRRIVEVFAVVGTSGRTPVNIRPYAGRFAASDGVYVFRDSTGQWTLGTCVLDAYTDVLLVFTAPALTPLKDDAAYPSAVPEDFQELIALRAAVIGKVHENRDASNVAGFLAEGTRLMAAKMGTMHSPNTARNWGN